jgi:hypothetical protein
MSKILLYFIIIFVTSLNYVLANDRQEILAGISFNTQGKNFFVKYKEPSSAIEKLSKTYQPEVKLLFANNFFNNINNQATYYSGYQNVEGFKNSQGRNDKIVAASIISAGVITLAAATIAVIAIAGAL